MNSNENNYNESNIKNHNREKDSLKEILSPMILEVIGKKYTDIYLKNLGDKYYELIDNLIDKKKLRSSSNSNTKINSGDESFLNKNKTLDNKNKTNKDNLISTFWKDYDFVNNACINKQINKINNLNNKDNSYFINMVRISKNNQSNEEEQSESIIIKNKDEENETDEM